MQNEIVLPSGIVHVGGTGVGGLFLVIIFFLALHTIIAITLRGVYSADRKLTCTIHDRLMLNYLSSFRIIVYLIIICILSKSFYVCYYMDMIEAYISV